MPEPDFTLKRGDTASIIRATLENSGGTAIDLQNAAVQLKMAPIAGGTLTVGAAATVDQIGDYTTGSSIGQVHYAWAAENVSTAGLYVGEWEVTFASGTIQTFPNTGFFTVHVSSDLPVS